jgi:hypothetical protein
VGAFATKNESCEQAVEMEAAITIKKLVKARVKLIKTSASR